MTSIKFIKRRIASVNSTKQIMKAMDMVAAAKLQKAKAKLDTVRPMLGEANRIMNTLKAADKKGTNIFFEERKIQNTAYVVISSDRGLCGAYNLNVSEKAFRHMIREKKNEAIIAIGSKGQNFFRRRGKNILKRYDGLSDTVFFDEAERVVDYLVSLYVSGEIDEAYITYTRFESALSYTPTVVKLFPMEKKDEKVNISEEMKYEPTIEAFMEYAIPVYLKTLLYVAMVESVTCENAARMVSMDSATHNASDIIDKLTRRYNRIRQAAITQEISEIISGANMLK